MRYLALHAICLMLLSISIASGGSVVIEQHPVDLVVNETLRTVTVAHQPHDGFNGGLTTVSFRTIVFQTVPLYADTSFPRLLHRKRSPCWTITSLSRWRMPSLW